MAATKFWEVRGVGKKRAALGLGLAFALACAVVFGGCTSPPQASSQATLVGGSLKRGVVSSSAVQFTSPSADGVFVNVETSKGLVRFVLYPQYAPLAVENFCALASQGYYDGTPFNRVVRDFVVQGGEPSDGSPARSFWGGPFTTERSQFLRHYSGALCMAGTDGAENSNLSQFYVVATPQAGLPEEALAALLTAGVGEDVVATYRQAGGAPYLDNTDTVFGQVVEGMDVIDSIAVSAVQEDGFTPKTPVTVQKVTVENYIPLYLKGRPVYSPPPPEVQPDAVAEGEDSPLEGDTPADGG